ncbi:MAG: MFS transporter [bacterium]
MSYRRLLIALMAPTLSVITMLAMFAVAIPSLRAEFSLTEDVASWLQVAYAMPFMMSMPLYGRLANGLGARRLLLLGLGLFIAGTVVLMFLNTLPMIFLARVIQGLGAGGVNPMSMAIIMHNAPDDRRGNMLGTWNSIGPIAGMLGPLAGGILIDLYGWRSIFGFALAVAIPAMVLAWRGIPFDSRDAETSGRDILRTFDWPGVILFNAAIVLFVFYLSSRPVTGMSPLTDWRLAVGALAVGVLFVKLQRRRRNPFIRLSIFRNRNFSFASICVSIRMALMGGITFVAPLYVTDLFSLSATAAGAVITLHSFALLITMRLGGVLVDRYYSRLQIIVGLSIESVAMLALALLPVQAGLPVVLTAIAVHGLGAGLCLAALHLFALSSVSRAQSATAAGLYSMVRFAGSMFGQAVGGVVLFAGISRFGLTGAGYTPVFVFYLLLSLVGAAAAFGLTPKLVVARQREPEPVV